MTRLTNHYFSQWGEQLNGVKYHYFWLGGKRVARGSYSSGVVYLYADQLSSTGVTRGTAAGTQLYDPYGATRYGGAGVAYQYTGQRNEASLGIYYYGARWYDPSIGRFMQADTIVPNPANPQSLNRYSYVLNNPLKYTDPTGHVQMDAEDGSYIYLIKHVYDQIYPKIDHDQYTTLDALCDLSDFTAWLTSNNAGQFVEGMGAVITGYYQGSAAIQELYANHVIPEFISEKLGLDNLGMHNVHTGEDGDNDPNDGYHSMGQSGFAPIYQDPDTAIGGDQPHHLRYYLQVAYEVFPFEIITTAGVIAHETIIPRNNPAGKSIQDVLLGFRGQDLGVMLRLGIVKPDTLSKYLRSCLSSG